MHTSITVACVKHRCICAGESTLCTQHTVEVARFCFDLLLWRREKREKRARLIHKIAAVIEINRKAPFFVEYLFIQAVSKPKGAGLGHVH